MVLYQRSYFRQAVNMCDLHFQARSCFYATKRPKKKTPDHLFR